LTVVGNQDFFHEENVFACELVHSLDFSFGHFVHVRKLEQRVFVG
jgi:hypothetical protein